MSLRPRAFASSASSFLPASTYTAVELARLGLLPKSPDLRILSAKVRDIDRPASRVVLSDGSRLPYDILVLTPGLTEPTLHRLPLGGQVPAGVHAVASPLSVLPLERDVRVLLDAAPNESVLPEHVLHLEAGGSAMGGRGDDRPDVFREGDDFGAGSEPPSRDGRVPIEESELRVGVEAGRDVVVYGDGLEALCSIQALIDRGVHPRRILFVRNAAELRALATKTPASAFDGAHFPAERVAASLAQLGVGEMIGWNLTGLTATSSPSAAVGDLLHEWGSEAGGGAEADPEVQAARAAVRDRRLVLSLLSLGGEEGVPSLGPSAEAETKAAEAAAAEAVESATAAALAAAEEDEEEEDELDDDEVDEEERERRHRSREERRRAREPTGVRKVSLDCRLLICAHKRDVDPQFFSAVNECGLVYDGRLVVDHRFATADPAILAGGTVVKFSRRYRAPFPLQAYSSREVGSAVAQEVLRRVDPFAESLRGDAGAGSGSDDVASVSASSGSATPGSPARGSAGGPSSSSILGAAKGSARLPRFTQSRWRAALLPGGWNWFLCHLPYYELGGTGRELVTHAIVGQSAAQELGHLNDAPPSVIGDSADDRHFRLVLDRFGRVAEVAVTSRKPVETANLNQLVGRHHAFLRGLLRDADAGRIPDLVDHLRGDWATVLYHDRLDDFVRDGRHVLVAEDEHVQALVRDVVALAERAGADHSAAHAADRSIVETLKLRVGTVGAALQPSTRQLIEARTIRFLKEERRLLPGYFLPGQGL